MEVFIGRVPTGVGVDTLTEIFAPYGASNVRMLEGKGCAFANFETTREAERAINELNGYSLGGSGSGLNVKLADAKGAPPLSKDVGKAKGGGAGGKGNNEAPQLQPEVFIGRLPPGMTNREMEELLVPYGAQNVRVLDGKNCAFANFDSWATAERVIAELNGSQLGQGGNPEGLNVKFADVKGAARPPQEPKVFIGGISQEVNEDYIRQVCQRFGDVTHVKIFAKNKTAMPCAFVTFATFTEAEVCMTSLNGIEHPLAAEGKYLVAKLADLTKGKQSSVAQPPIMYVSAPQPMRAPPAMHGGGQYSAQSTYGGTAASGGDDPRPFGGGQGPKVFIGGLPEAASEDFVWGMMAAYGRVAEAKVLRKPGALPCGFVRFSHPSEAEQAVASLMDRCRFTVKFADDPKNPAKRSAGTAFGGEAGWNRRMR